MARRKLKPLKLGLIRPPKKGAALNVKKKSNYIAVRNFVNVFETQVVEIAENEIKAMAQAFAKYVKQIIYQQKYKWKPLSKRYLAKKIELGLDRRILIATKAYVKSIRAVQKQKDKKVVAWSVGPGGPNTVHKPSGLKTRTLAVWLEFGTKKMPARPHWRPAWRVFTAKKHSVAKKMIKEAIKKSKKGKQGKTKP